LAILLIDVSYNFNTQFLNINCMYTSKMKILFIQPKLNTKSSFLNKTMSIIESDQFYYLHFSIFYLAQITPLNYSIKIADERYKKINFNQNCDLVVVTFSTSFAHRAYEIADTFRKKGKTVIIGGQHASLIPNEAKNHADSVIIGEPDVIWLQLLSDFENGSLKPFYKNKEFPNPNKIKRVRFNFKNRFTVARIDASRGCPNCCRFCLAPVLLGDKQRLRPIENVISEIKSTKNKVINFDDSSLTNNITYAKQLFVELKKLNKKFICCGNVDTLNKDDVLLKLARDAGCIAWFIGFESVNQNALDEIGKKTNKIIEYKSVVQRIHENKMAVIGSFIFGFDADTVDVFDKTLEAIKKLGLDSVDFNILTVYPGTPLFEIFEKEERILTKDWSEYNFGRAVFKPKNMTSTELENNTLRVAQNFFSFSNILRRSLHALKLGFYPFIFIFLRSFLFRKFYKSWK